MRTPMLVRRCLTALFLMAGASVALFDAPPALAHRGRSGELFIDRGFIAPWRPDVPSDRARGQDMFPSVPLAWERDADLFDRVRPRFDFGREDMFVTRPVRVPDYPLFRDR